jgi:L-aminopeptidase/D-esterase-like protein
MGPADLQRLAVQVHTSMARAIQPFSTYNDGDTLFAVSTQEVGEGVSLDRVTEEIDSLARRSRNRVDGAAGSCNRVPASGMQ